MKVLFDSNVIIDAFSERGKTPFSARELFMKSLYYEIEGYMAAKQITDIYYVLRKYVNDTNIRKRFISLLLRGLTILPDTKEDYLNALNINGNDFEDDLLIYLAEKNDIDVIVTNNTKDFSSSKVKIMNPSDLMKNEYK